MPTLFREIWFMRKFMTLTLFIAVFSQFGAKAATRCEVALPGDFDQGHREQLIAAGYTIVPIMKAQVNWISFENFVNRYVNEGQYAFSSTSTLGDVLTFNSKGGYDLYKKVNGKISLISTKWSKKMNSESVIQNFLPQCKALE
jgi:hypothetical protein